MPDNILNSSKSRPAVLLFDVNETLLDLSDMQRAVNKTFDNELAFKLWFSHLLEYALVENATNEYHTFSEVGQAAMKMVTKVIGQDVPEAKQKELVEMVKQTQPHPDVIPGLKKLQEAGFRMATLTNSPSKSSIPHLESVGLKEFFEETFSVDSVKKFKPDSSPYQYAADQLGVQLGDVMMVAAHGWDMAGALRAGARAAFLSRPGQTLYPLAPEPELTAPTLSELADKLVKLG
ncbi:haloacid dehalogenase type II [Pontibacter akesuensis]|uniref:2-haloacid dehalogenase n=1 Tax=Pontibacter akesuensis TaxID=388950 RepID=A0A1I7IEX9_9BACT|nr:haloacid dehalogenase type II [Pontibacter akesuensis]GHA66869.1 haloacid dehalogenase [Pontibacter akesuensis]SFU71477.1 2-haloacid dehalogenase [Pontibacter akesuensis]